MWNGFCGNLIRRGNRNLLILLVVILGCFCAFFGWKSRYFLNFFRGPRTLTQQQLTAIPSAEQAKDQFVRVQAGRTVITGVTHITTDDSHPNGYVDSVYLITVINDQLMIVRAPQSSVESQPRITDSAVFEGRLVPLTGDLKTDIVDRVNQRNPDAKFLPFYVDEQDFKSFGWVSVIIGTPILLITLWSLWLWLQRTGDFARHPFAKKLAVCGPLEMLTQQIDAETSQAHLTVKKGASAVDVTQRWMIAATLFGGAPMRLEDLVWAYRHIMKRKIYFLITVSKRHSIIAYDRLGRKIQVQLDEGKVTEVLQQLARSAPHAVFGYDKQLEKLWKKSKDKSGFLPQARAMLNPPDPEAAKSTTMSQV